jgi:hypothetical protein
MMDPLIVFRVMEEGMDGTWNSGVPIEEDRTAAFHRSRLARAQESQSIDEPYRSWWLAEQGWLVDPGTNDRGSRLSALNVIVLRLADALLAASTWLRSRSKPVAGLG